jgi:hypothetical protein
MLPSLKACFFDKGRRSTLLLPIHRWRFPMQVLFKSRHPQATGLRELTGRRMRQHLVGHEG